MKLSERQVQVVAIIAVVFVIGLVYFIWTRSGVPEPTIPPGQTLAKPFGEAGGPMRGAPSQAGRPRPPTGFTANNGGVPVNVPAPGTVDPKRGFGPSQGARIPQRP